CRRAVLWWLPIHHTAPCLSLTLNHLGDCAARGVTRRAYRFPSHPGTGPRWPVPGCGSDRVGGCGGNARAEIPGDQWLERTVGLSVGWSGWLGWSLGCPVAFPSGAWLDAASASSLVQNASTASFPPAAVMRAWNAGFSSALP